MVALLLGIHACLETGTISVFCGRSGSAGIPRGSLPWERNRMNAAMKEYFQPIAVEPDKVTDDRTEIYQAEQPCEIKTAGRAERL